MKSYGIIILIGALIFWLGYLASTATSATYLTTNKDQVHWYTPGKNSVWCFYQIRSSGTFKVSNAGHVQCESWRTGWRAWIDKDKNARSKKYKNLKPNLLQRRPNVYKPIKNGWRRHWKRTGVTCSLKGGDMLCSTFKNGAARGFMIGKDGVASVIYLLPRARI